MSEHSFCLNCGHEWHFSMHSTPDLTTLEREVVEASERWRSGRDLMNVRAEGSGAEALFHAVDALLDARKPKGVKPSEVAPGTRFRFVECDPEDPAFIMVENVETGGRFALNERTHTFRPIWPGIDRILPLNPQEPV